jgi:hypothetical protein
MIYASSKSELAASCKGFCAVGSRKSLQDWGASGAPLDKGPHGYDVAKLVSWLFARAGNPETDEPSWAAKRSQERFLKQSRTRIEARAKLLPREAGEVLCANLVVHLVKELQKLEATLPEAIQPDGDVDPIRIAVRARTRRIRIEARKALTGLCATPERFRQTIESVHEQTGVNLLEDGK